MANVFVTADIKEQGAKLIQDGSGSSVRNGVELLLKNDLCFGNEEGKPPSDAVNAGPLVQEGLTMLVNYPFDALDISIESQTVDVRKAYKKMALKYPIQNAHERLTNLGDRKEEEEKQKQADAAAAAQAQKKSAPPKAKTSSSSSGASQHRYASTPGSQNQHQPQPPSPSSFDQQRQQQQQQQKRQQAEDQRAREQGERWKQEEEEKARAAAAAAAAAAQKKADEEAAALVFPVPSNLQLVNINATTVQLQWSPPPACAYTRPPSYLRTELGWRVRDRVILPTTEEEDEEQEGEVRGTKKDKSEQKEKVSEWTLLTIMRDQTEVIKDNLPAGKCVEFVLRFYIQPTAANQGQIIRGDWCDPVSLTLPQSELPPSPKKHAKGSTTVGEVNDGNASLYHRFLRSVSSLRNDTSTFSECRVDDDIVPDNWVSDEEDDSDADEKEESHPRRPHLSKTNSFRELEVKWHQLMPPTSHLGSGRYVHSVHSESDVASPVIGYVTTARKVQAKIRKGEWILVQAHAHSQCLGTSSSASFSGFPWGWVQRSQWVESIQKQHIFLRPIPTSLKEVKKYKFLASVHSIYSLKEEVEKKDRPSSQQTQTGDTPVTEEDELDDEQGVYHEHAEEDVWYEQQDPASGGVYYYNSTTGESTWEAPEWVVEYDEYSGIRYFVKLDTTSATPLQSKWSLPPTAFSKLVRLQATNATS